MRGCLPAHLDVFLALNLREPVARTRSAYDFYNQGFMRALFADVDRAEFSRDEGLGGGDAMVAWLTSTTAMEPIHPCDLDSYSNFANGTHEVTHLVALRPTYHASDRLEAAKTALAIMPGAFSVLEEGPDVIWSALFGVGQC